MNVYELRIISSADDANIQTGENEQILQQKINRVMDNLHL
jgi:hypothetical protein